MATADLDVVCLGRSSVDLYGEQVGGPLEDMRSFAKYVGGCPTNIAIGTARLGLKSGLITGVGDEHMGRFIRQTLEREGVDTACVKTDPARLTALVILGIRDAQSFPHIFYRENCADMGLTAEDIDPGYIARAKALVVTGTHLSTEAVAGATRAAIAAAKASGTKVVFDIDFRPVLWRLVGHGSGDQRAGVAAQVSQRLSAIVPDCDLIVGTEEEFQTLAARADIMGALRQVRALGAGTLVLKRGPAGCQIFAGALPEALDEVPLYPGFPVEVFNTLGAGDGFMSGFLRGWVRGEDLETCARYANACGAIVVSRHGCAPAIPTWRELASFMETGVRAPRLRDDRNLEELHRKTLRRRLDYPILALAFDHRTQLEELCSRHAASLDRISRFKDLIGMGARRAMDGRPGRGAIVDGRYGQAVLYSLTGEGWWLARPVEAPGSRPLDFEDGPHIALTLQSWPNEIVAKCLVHYHPDDDGSLRERQVTALLALQAACRSTERELLLEVIPPSTMPRDRATVVRALAQLYDAGLSPDWWKLPAPEDSAVWDDLSALLTARDPLCRGVLLLGLNATEADLTQAFAMAAAQPWCKGFAIGRSVFAEPAEAWFADRLSDDDLVASIADSYGRLVSLWAQHKGGEAGQ
jgi:5-dehydro-2-deoxygluconokinase